MPNSSENAKLQAYIMKLENKIKELENRNIILKIEVVGNEDNTRSAFSGGRRRSARREQLTFVRKVDNASQLRSESNSPVPNDMGPSQAFSRILPSVIFLCLYS